MLGFGGHECAVLKIPVTRVGTLAVGEELTRRFTSLQSNQEPLDVGNISSTVENGHLSLRIRSLLR